MAENTTQSGLDALLNDVAFAPIHNVGWIRVTGEDRVRWLNGMVTNSIQALTPGEGCYCFFLNAQGRIQADATVWLEQESILLQTAADRVPALMEMLDRFIIMDDVELAATNWMGNGLVLAGPGAPAALTATGFSVPADGLHQTTREDTGDVLIRGFSPLVPRFEIWSGSLEDLRGLATTLRLNGAAQADLNDLEALRILEGTPLFGTDIRDKDLPQETNQTRALHFAKGCYLGQEIVERIRSRGAVHRTFHGFILTGELAAPGTPLYTTDPAKPVGEITSVLRIGSSIYALGYIRREALETKADIHYTGGDAQPTSLPFPHPTT